MGPGMYPTIPLHKTMTFLQPTAFNLSGSSSNGGSLLRLKELFSLRQDMCLYLWNVQKKVPCLSYKARKRKAKLRRASDIKD